MPEPIHTFPHEAMTTHWEIAIAGQERSYAHHAARAAFRELDRLEGILSRYIETSDIARANRLPLGGSLLISDDTLECLLIAADVSLATNRAFDPAYASVRPNGLAADAPPFTLDPDTHLITSRAERLHLDLGAVGKGFALDRMGALLLEWGITSACLNAGGSSILALETPPEPNSPGWGVTLGEGRSRREIPLLDGSLSASGTSVKGEHLVDPRTGHPAARVARAWALAPNAAQADALATAFFVMGEAESARLCGAHPSIGAALTTADGFLITHGALRAR